MGPLTLFFPQGRTRRHSAESPAPPTCTSFSLPSSSLFTGWLVLRPKDLLSPSASGNLSADPAGLWCSSCLQCAHILLTLRGQKWREIRWYIIFTGHIVTSVFIFSEAEWERRKLTHEKNNSLAQRWITQLIDMYWHSEIPTTGDFSPPDKHRIHATSVCRHAIATCRTGWEPRQAAVKKWRWPFCSRAVRPANLWCTWSL